MAVTNVALREDLRPWYNAGLNYLFIDDAVEAWLEEGKEAQQAASAPATQGAGQHSAPSAQNRAHAYGSSAPVQSTEQSSDARKVPTSQAPSHAGRQSSLYQSGAAQAPVGSAGSQQPAPKSSEAASARPKYTPQESADACTMREDAPKPPEASTLPPEQWPPAWQSAWAKISGPAPVVWTYWSLGDDLCGKANAERGALLRRIIGSLQLPRGTSAFWPVAMPQHEGQDASGESNLIADPSLFLAGIERIKPRRVFAFGSRALHSFAPHCGLRPYQFVHFNGFRLYAMPDIDYLLESPGPVDAVISCLRVALQQTRR